MGPSSSVSDALSSSDTDNRDKGRENQRREEGGRGEEREGERGGWDCIRKHRTL